MVENMARALGMKQAYERGESLETIGREWGISRERVRQLLSRAFGFNGSSGGQSIVRKKSAENRLKQKDAYYVRVHGHSYLAHCQHKAEFGGTAVKAFRQQRNNARRRGIGWAFSFAEWFAFWTESGHWKDRGLTGYCMCRHGDRGVYSRANCYIATMARNTSDMNARRKLICQKDGFVIPAISA
jgi:hypothetical protein